MTRERAHAARARGTRSGSLRAAGLAACALGALWMACSAGDAAEDVASRAHATLFDQDGRQVGEATLLDTPSGVLVSASLEGLPEGEHAFHIHETGQCEGSFTSAGGHLNPGGEDHGFLDPDGHHAGDLPNIVVPASGELDFEVLAPGVTVTGGSHALLGGDGTALMIHRGADDYRTDPAGAAGERIACGVIRATGS